MSTGTSSNSSSFSYRVARTRCVGIERGIPWTLMGAMIAQMVISDREQRRDRARSRWPMGQGNKVEYLLLVL
jgi:hypothetical protein